MTVVEISQVAGNSTARQSRCVQISEIHFKNNQELVKEKNNSDL